jgi:hypothetical protein
MDAANRRETFTKSKAAQHRYFYIVLICTLMTGIGCCTTSNNPKVFHIGVLSGFEFFSDVIDGFKSQMTELGYTEGKNVVYDIQKAPVDMEAYKMS